MLYRNNSNDTLEIPGVGTLSPGCDVDTTVELNDERLSVVYDISTTCTKRKKK